MYEITKDPKSGVYLLPPVGRIQGISLIPDEDPHKAVVELQYTDQNSEWYESVMPLLDALYLLNLLEAMSREQGFDELRRPPKSNA